MNAYTRSVIDHVEKKHSDEPEFIQTVKEVLSSLSPVLDAHPEYEKADFRPVGRTGADVYLPGRLGRRPWKSTYKHRLPLPVQRRHRPLQGRFALSEKCLPQHYQILGL